MTTALEETYVLDSFGETIPEPAPPKRRGRPPGSTNRTRQPRDETDKTAVPEPKSALKPAEKQLATLLAGPVIQLGTMASMAAPTTGTILAIRAQATMEALVLYASDKPKLMAQLKNVSKVGPLSEIAQTLGSLVIALQLDLGTMQPDHMVAQLSGVAEVHLQIQGNLAAAYAGMQTPGGTAFPAGDASSG